MSVINGRTNHVEHSVLSSVWAHLGDADTGTVEQLARYPIKHVTVTGTFGGATVTLEGSDDGATYATLTGENPAGGADSPVTFTAAGTMAFTDNPRFLRPRTASGTGTDVTVTLTSRQFGH